MDDFNSSGKTCIEHSRLKPPGCAKLHAVAIARKLGVVMEAWNLGGAVIAGSHWDGRQYDEQRSLLAMERG